LLLGSNIPFAFCKFVILWTGCTIGVVGTVGVVGVIGVVVGVVGVTGVGVPSKHTCLVASKFLQATQVLVFKLKYPTQLIH